MRSRLAVAGSWRRQRSARPDGRPGVPALTLVLLLAAVLLVVAVV
ncbi:hypothetical protein ACPC54_27065 [Kitasatospora sp. NPDC094028]